MKIVPKLTAALVCGMCVVLAINGYFRVRRERAAFEAERMRRHVLIGRAVRAAVRASWTTEGEEAALSTLSTAVARYEPMAARWLPAGSSEPRHADAVQLASASDPLTTIDRTRDPATWFTYVPVVVNGARLGDIELAEPATADARNARRVVLETLEAAAGLAALSAVIAFFLGQWLVGRPVRALAEKARRIGRGEFGHPVDLASNDELAELAHEMNAMCDRLAATLEQLRHADRLATVGKLASGVAHELGTPLNVVSARAEMIMAGTSPEESRDYAQVIAKAVGRMTAIIGQLLQFARRKGIQRTHSDPVALARETVDLLRPFAKKRHVAIELDAGTCTPVSVDAAQLQQVLTNLLMNALHASRENGRVTLRVDERVAAPPADMGGARRQCVCLVVADDGAGIEPENLTRIFEPFFTTKDVGEGTGLGLAVSYGIVREHGGWMTVDSTVGLGSTFTVYLPREATS
jgi:signal transduction histidine kinase